MPVTIRVGLKKDGTRDILRNVGGNGEGFGEVWEIEKGVQQEKFLQRVK